MLKHNDINTDHTQYLQLWQVSQLFSSTENQLCALWLQEGRKKKEGKKHYTQDLHTFSLSKSNQFPDRTLHNNPKAYLNNPSCYYIIQYKTWHFCRCQIQIYIRARHSANWFTLASAAIHLNRMHPIAQGFTGFREGSVLALPPGTPLEFKSSKYM